MPSPSSKDFARIAQALTYIAAHQAKQPSLEEIAAQVGLRSSHFQRLFTRWAGTSPKKFLQYLSLERAKQLLREENLSLLKTAQKTGLSGTGRLHDLFIQLEGMTPDEYKQGGVGLTITYQFSPTLFGKALIAATRKGVCLVSFAQTSKEGLQDLRKRFPNAKLIKHVHPFQTAAIRLLQGKGGRTPISLHVHGTPFQLHVWQALIRIPDGRLSNYGALAAQIKRPKACRAVGTAVGDNPVAFLIPCHRVIQSTGQFGNYHWGQACKLAMIGWEAAREEKALLHRKKISQTKN